MKNGLIWFCRIAVGLLFIFSGLIKINDPLGFSYKLEEYFEVFHITFLNSLAVSTAILLCALEIILGFALLIGVRAKQVAWGLLLLIVFFAFLTFYSAFFKVRKAKKTISNNSPHATCLARTPMSNAKPNIISSAHNKMAVLTARLFKNVI